MNNMLHRLTVYMTRRMIACDEAGYLVSVRQDRRLSPREWWKLRMHLVTCHLCRKYTRQIEQMSHLIRRYRQTCSGDSGQHRLTESASRKISEAVQRGLK